jgi:hypothetical protein
LLYQYKGIVPIPSFSNILTLQGQRAWMNNMLHNVKGYNKTEYCQYETEMTNNHLYECEMKTVMIEESHMRKHLKEDCVKCNTSSIFALRIRTSLNFLPWLRTPLWETSTYLINISLAMKQTINTSYLHFSHVNKASFRHCH